MTAPRATLPGCYYLITRRCTQRQFLLRPGNKTNQAFLYCLAEAAARYGIEIAGYCDRAHLQDGMHRRRGRVR
jgi:REP-associated tyrosine transposase